MGRPTTLPEPWRSLAEKLGSVQALADVLLCDVRTVNRWANGETQPDRRAREWIQAAFHQAGIPPP
jgi:transcriptional regulator with XRE-family HTH domain